MCGIAAAINTRLNLSSVDFVMGHRGPDERNDYQFKNIHFYHLRLSILDISGGKQPMHIEDKYSIIFNGEIYNHQEVRKKLNLQCQTNSDTETILKAYEKVGSLMLNEFDGMFALILLDKVKNKLFVARDRAGKKPIYYSQNNEQFFFASELNAIRAHLDLEINTENINSFLHIGSFFKTQTPYMNVFEVEAGSFLEIDLNNYKVTKTKWWSIEKFYDNPQKISFEEAKSKTDLYLTQAVKRRIDSSDLEVGSFLSGGIDSGLVTAIAAQNHSKLKTFTVSFEGQFNEAPLAKLVSDKYSTDHTEISISFDNLTKDIEKIVSNYGEPFCDSSAIPSFYVSQAAKKYLTVILNGDGGDEMFGGYRRNVLSKYLDLFSTSTIKSTASKNILNFLPKSDNKKSYYNFLYRALTIASAENVSERYLSSTIDTFQGYESNLKLGYSGLENGFYPFMENVSSKNWSSLNKLLYSDFEINLAGDLLVKMDIATMAHSLEGRSPFLCKEILEFAPSLSDNFKIKGTTTKYILRDLSKKYLPEKLLNQPKRGFEIPLKNWVDSVLKEIINDYLRQSNTLSSSFVNQDFIISLLENKNNIEQEKRAKMIWILFSLEVWNQKVFVG